VYDRERLRSGRTVEGPAVVEGGESTVVVPPRWDVAVREDGALIAEVSAA